MIYPESIGKVKVGDLVAFNCRDLDGSTAMVAPPRVLWLLCWQKRTDRPM